MTRIARLVGGQLDFAISALVVKQLDQSLADAGELVDFEGEAFSLPDRL